MLSWIVVVLSALFAGLWLIDSLLRGKKSKNGCGLPPGPKWGLPLLGHLHMFGDLPHHDLHKLSQKHGPIMHIRLGVVPTIVVSSPEAAELFMKTHDLAFASRPKMNAVKDLNYWENDISFSQYGAHWRDIRKMCTLQLLSATKIESMKSMRKDHVDSFIRGLKDAARANVVVNLTEKIGCLIEDMTYDMIFGREYDMFDFKPSAHEFLKLFGTLNIADYVPFVGLLDLQGIRRRMKAATDAVDGLLEKIVDQHEQKLAAAKTPEDNNNRHKNFIDGMHSLTQPGKMLQKCQFGVVRVTMKAIVVNMIIASIDTSTVAIEWAVCELFRHPKMMKKLQLELESVVGLDRMVEESDLGKLRYLDMVLKESLRLHPVAPLLSPREAREDMTINGYFIPKQSRIYINTWTIGHDPKVWSSNVEEFYPERFRTDTNVEYRGNDFRFIPFGSGRRGCPGYQLGVIAVKSAMAQLLHCFNWELPDGMSPDDLDMEEKPGMTTPRVKPLLAVPTYRLHI